ncbi:ferric-dicitrate binding protein FerR (iron transport regulator) [Pedobacter cryoconitis]|uniref:FecR family protein n=1 Tax=Pedobacter cryoconitis TaxID=188932 RepID=UPI00161908CA|nr:FecR domain-containing protein [Pedobacter cryoconitis]MBB6273178.1 ferric-dicitrate binding protein FerR (iron transport regulator) [Pedobacter cryoconitis]
MDEYDYRLIIGYLESSISDDEVQQLLAKVQNDKEFAEGFNEIAELWNAGKKINNNIPKAQNALARLHQRMDAAEIPLQQDISSKKVYTISKNMAWLSAIAAMVLLCLALVFYQSDSSMTFKPDAITYIEKHTAAGQKMNITLPDGSLVVLNTLSSIKIPSDYGNKNREILLKGEAWFEVEKNPEKPFIVHSGNIQTLVLGTKFNVSGYADDEVAKVSLVEGKVQVDIDNDARKRQILKPGDQLVYDKKDKSSLVKPFIKEYAAGWKDNTLTLDYESWPEAAKKISRWYNVRVDLKNADLKDCKLKGSFAGMALTQVLKRLSYISGISWEIKEKTVYITGKCN